MHARFEMSVDVHKDVRFPQYIHIHVNHNMHVLKFYCLFIVRKENLPNSNWENANLPNSNWEKSESSKFKANYQMKNK